MFDQHVSLVVRQARFPTLLRPHPLFIPGSHARSVGRYFDLEDLRNPLLQLCLVLGSLRVGCVVGVAQVRITPLVELLLGLQFGISNLQIPTLRGTSALQKALGQASQFFPQLEALLAAFTQWLHS